MVRFLAGFYVAHWPFVLAGALLAAIGAGPLRGRGFGPLLVAAAGTWIALAIVEWARLRHSLAKNPRFSAPATDLLYDLAMHAVWLGLVVLLVFAIGKLNWPTFLGAVSATLAALILPPLVAVGLLFLGCYVFGNCL